MTQFEILATALALAVKAKEPVILWDDPGSGKSSYVRALSAALDLPCEVVIAALREPADFAGLPVIREAGVVLEPPRWAVSLKRAGKGILCLDECSTAPPAVQAALLRVINEKWVGDLELPDDVTVVAIANPPESAAGGWNLTPPAANRFVHINWKVDAATWAHGMRTNFKDFVVKPNVPDTWQDYIPSAVSEITSFVERARPDLLRQIPDGVDAAGKAFPSHRTWHKAANLLAICQATLGQRTDNAVLACLLGGAVGEGAALEFISWRNRMDLPDPESLLAAPDKFELKGPDDRDYAIMNAVVSAFAGRPTPSRWTAAWAVLAHAVKLNKPDLATPAARALLSARTLMSVPPPIPEAASAFGVILAKAKIR